jgi:hypothetical protein
MCQQHELIRLLPPGVKSYRQIRTKLSASHYENQRNIILRESNQFTCAMTKRQLYMASLVQNKNKD